MQRNASYGSTALSQQLVKELREAQENIRLVSSQTVISRDSEASAASPRLSLAQCRSELHKPRRGDGRCTA